MKPQVTIHIRRLAQHPNGTYAGTFHEFGCNRVFSPMLAENFDDEMAMELFNKHLKPLGYKLVLARFTIEILGEIEQ